MPDIINDSSITHDFCNMSREGFFEHAVSYLAKYIDVDAVVLSTFGIVYKQHVTVKASFCKNINTDNINYHIDNASIQELLAGRMVEIKGRKKTKNIISINGELFLYSFSLPILNVKNKVLGHLSFLKSDKKLDMSNHFSGLRVATFRIAIELERVQQAIKIDMLNLGLSLPKGVNYFEELTKLMTHYLDVDYAFIGHIAPLSIESVQLSAMAHREDIIDVVTLPIPAINVVPTLRDPYLITINQLDIRLFVSEESQVINTQCIIGLYLFNKENQVIGLFGVISEKYIESIKSIKSVLDSFALGALRELEGQNAKPLTDYKSKILASTSDLLSFIDTDFVYRALNDAYIYKLDLPKEQLIDCLVADVHGQEAFENVIRPSLIKSFAGDTDSVEFIRKNSSGSDMVIHAKHHPYYNNRGQIVGVVVSGTDITQLKEQQQTTAKNEEWMQLLYHQTPSMFFTVDTQYCISSANDFVTKKLGYEVNELINIKMHHVYSIDDKDNIEQLLRRCFDNPEQLHEWEIRQRRRDNSIVWVKQSAQVVTTTDVGMQILLASEDITQKHKRSLELSYQATHDALTGLVNRLEFERTINELIMHSTERVIPEHVLCYIDLDNFKIVNDVCGHSAGDELLKNIAAILSNEVRRNDVVCRMGGDEFTILMESCLLQKGIEIADKFRLAIERFIFIWKGEQFKVSASIGMTSFTNERTYTDIISSADEACYVAKNEGRNCVRVFDMQPRILSANEKRTQSLKQAMLDEKFELYAQPVFKVGDVKTVFGYEFLLRMHYQSELITASQFLSYAQRFDYLISIDRWVVNQAFDWINNHDSLTHLRYTINLSTDSVSSPEFLEFVVQKLLHYAIDGEKICFEIKELSIAENLKDVVNFMSQLAQYNATFILDNFGGESSLFGHIKSLPIDVVKIDGALTSCLIEQDINVATIRAINDIAHVVDKTTIATFVEDEATLQCLTDIGVDYVQGDLLGKAKPIRLIC